MIACNTKVKFCNLIVYWWTKDYCPEFGQLIFTNIALRMYSHVTYATKSRKNIQSYGLFSLWKLCFLQICNTNVYRRFFWIHSPVNRTTKMAVQFWWVQWNYFGQGTGDCHRHSRSIPTRTSTKAKADRTRSTFTLEGPVGLEPTTPCLKGKCSNRLSYGPD